MTYLSRRNFILAGTASILAAPAVAATNPYVIPRHHQSRIVSIKASMKPGEIHVDPKQFALYWTLKDGKAIRYPVAIGEPGKYYSGRFTIGRKAEWPTWTPTKAMMRRNPAHYAKYAGGMPGGPENPLGSRALYLYKGSRDSLLRIHGTTQPWLVATQSSNGCVRMINEHVEDLFERAGRGTRVVLH